MKRVTLGRVCRCIDAVFFILFAAAMILFATIGKPYQRGFFCNDESVSKPFKKSTIPTSLAIAVGAVLSLVVIILTEILWYRQHKNEVRERREESICLEGICSKVPAVLWTIIWVIIAEAYGALLNAIITDIGKYSLGRLRPHFLSVCKPDWTKLQCRDSGGNYLFITADVCTGTDARLSKESRLSFPSGHSSFAAYVMVFLALYIEAKLHLPKESKFLKIIIQCILIMMALYTGFSRVSDYKHHWSDVLAGFALGTIMAFVTIFRVLQPRFKRDVIIANESQPINLQREELSMQTNSNYRAVEGP